MPTTVCLRVVALSALLTLATTGVAWAHVTVEPEEVAAGEYEKLTVTVPTEGEIPTTEVRVDVPEGFTLSGVKPVPGWEHAFEEEAGVVTAVTFSGGQIGPREFQEFEIQAQTPESPGDFTFGATQTYEDGSVAAWTGQADSEEPAPTVRVVAGSAEGHEHGGEGEEAVAAPTEDLPETGGTTFPHAAHAGLFAAGLALGLAAAALVRRKGKEA